MMNTLPAAVEALVADIPNGAKLAIPPDYSGVSMIATRALIRRGVRDLHLVCVPTSGLQTDLLIGAGCVRTVETAGVTLGEFGTAPRFAAAVKQGSIRLMDATCPAIHAALQAAEKGLPFMPLRGIIGSDILANRADWKVIDNPFGDNDPIVALPAITPDYALFHAPLADRDGNVWIGRHRELMLMAHAAKHTLATVDDISEHSLLDDDRLVAGVIPGLYISAVAKAEQGTWPINLWDRYPLDQAVIAEYARVARSEAGFEDFLARFLDGRLPPGQSSSREAAE